MENKMLEWIKNNYKSILSWLYRNIIVIGIIAICLYFLIPTKDIVRTIFYCVLFEAIAIYLSGVATNLFTTYKFLSKKSLKDIIYGADGKMSINELNSYINLVNTIIKSVHLVVGMTAIAIYFTQIIN